MSLELLNESKGIMELRLGSKHKMVANVTHYIGHVYNLKGKHSDVRDDAVVLPPATASAPSPLYH